ncbi:MAG: endonuclease III [Candidatus Omnitrophica bacterium CG07_land_8_20_14_0_80_42_15]|uniref:Endonuclease III n=1 Tax=Candidatus Aquitaenariimonas noxiae TaxID=1974741 RepID=A0A2J0L3P9_9BACT|nr:MAG: endonuclease III [Candidatus Omnitrophica bacterium CG07_land_8_20_14_0_80_42_15]
MVTNAQKAQRIFCILKKTYPRAKIALDFTSPIQLLVATILSAQCTDKRVNIVTESLFKKYKTERDYANADLKTFEKDIRSTGFYRNKAKNIIASAQKILKEFNGKVPDTMEALLTLPGVARKTANIVLSNAYGKIEGIAVDTHVRRLSGRLGFTDNENPEKIELDLMKLFPKDEWFPINRVLIEHGRNICNAKKPLCPECLVSSLCPSKKLFYPA